MKLPKFRTIKALPVSPILVMAGDPRQQRPLANKNESNECIYENLELKQQVHSFKLHLFDNYQREGGLD